MTTLISTDRVNITQKNFQQILIRGDGKDQFNQIINKEISLQPPSKNLEIKTSDKYIFAKNSFDQWTLVYLVEQDYKEIIKTISNLNSNDEILASDYSYGQVYFEVLGGIFWVWLPIFGINEVPTVKTLIGGGIITSAIIFYAFNTRRPLLSRYVWVKK